MSDPGPPSVRDLLRWAETLAAVARTGLAFTENLYERERFDEVLRVAADIRAAALDESTAEAQYDVWAGSIGSGVEGYVTPKSAVGAIVGNDAGEILLGRRADSGEWYYPVGWADVGYSPAEVAVKEVFEETGIEAEPVRLIAVFDVMRQGFSGIPLYSLVFHCRAVGGELRAHPLETLGVGFFARDALPSPLRYASRWVALAFDAIDGRDVPCWFDPPRAPMWRTPPEV